MVAGVELTDASAQPSPPTGDHLDPEGAATSPWWRSARDWAVLLTLVLWFTSLTHAEGGRDRFALTLVLLALVPALVVVRPWRHLRRREALALLPAALTLLACFGSPTRFDGLGALAAFAYVGVLYLLVRGYLDGGGRVGLVVAALLVAGIDQFVTSWWAWYGRQDSSSLMVGTFFWHNQFAVFMAALGLLAGGVVVRGSGRLRAVAAVVVVLAVPSLAFAASRSTLALFVAAWLVLVAVNVRRGRRAVALVLLPVVGFAFAALLASPLLMSSSSAVATNVQQRETAVGNGSARLVYDRVAVDLAVHHPVTGTGFGSFASASAPLMPHNLQPTAWVHNGFLQAFVDGGVTLGAAVLVLALVPLVVGLRRLRRDRVGRRDDDRADAATLGALLALGLLAAHSAVDTDWAYPALLALYGVLAAVVLRRVPASPADGEAATVAGSRGAGWTLLVPIAIAVALALPASVRSSVVAAPRAPVPGWTGVATLGLPMEEVPGWARGAGECAAELRGELAAPTTAELVDDLACTRRAARSEPSLAMLRARALIQLGRTDEGQAMAAEVADRYGAAVPQLLVLQAELPHDAGDDATAVRRLRAVLTDPRVAASPAAVQYAHDLLGGLGAEVPTTDPSGLQPTPSSSDARETTGGPAAARPTAPTTGAQ